MEEKKIKGRKRHLLVDTEGFILNTFVTSAGLSDQQGLFGILDSSIDHFPRLSKIWADSGYQGEYARSYCADFEVSLEIVKRNDQESGFKVVPRRWVVERTFAWLGRQRRLSKDYEYCLSTSETMIYLSMTRTMLRRAAHAI